MKRDERFKARISAEKKRLAGPIALTAVLLVASLVALFLPMWSIPLGVDLAGGNAVTLTATDYADGTDAADVLTVLRRRVDALEQHDVQVSQTGDDTFELRVPSNYDAASVADALTRGGALELVRVDSISDADVLQKLQNNASNIELEQGSYDAFVTSDEVKGASVVSQNYYGMTYYGISVSLDASGASALSDATEDLSQDGASGQIAVVMDGTIIASPSVSKKIEGGKINISGGFTEDQAYAYASAIAGGRLRCSLSQTEPAEVGATLGDDAPVLVLAAFLVVSFVACLVAARRLGAAGGVCAEAATVSVIIALGILTLVARFDVVVLGRMELAGLAVTELCALVAGVRVAVRYRSERDAGASVRKSQQVACGHERNRLMGVAGVVLVAAVVAAVLLPGHVREFAVSLACGMGALVYALAVAVPTQLALYTAADVAKGAQDAQDLESDEDEDEQPAPKSGE